MYDITLIYYKIVRVVVYSHKYPRPAARPGGGGNKPCTNGEQVENN